MIMTDVEFNSVKKQLKLESDLTQGSTIWSKMQKGEVTKEFDILY